MQAAGREATRPVLAWRGLLGRLLALLARALSPLLLDPLVVALRQRVEDGQDEEGDHGQHELLEDPAQQARTLKREENDMARF
jgi:hypothetical protein